MSHRFERKRARVLRHRPIAEDKCSVFASVAVVTEYTQEYSYTLYSKKNLPTEWIHPLRTTHNGTNLIGRSFIRALKRCLPLWTFQKTDSHVVTYVMHKEISSRQPPFNKSQDVRSCRGGGEANLVPGAPSTLCRYVFMVRQVCKRGRI